MKTTPKIKTIQNMRSTPFKGCVFLAQNLTKISKAKLKIKIGGIKIPVLNIPWPLISQSNKRSPDAGL